MLNILSNKKVLYAEDEKGIRKHITEVLELFFDKVVSVKDGLEATYEMNVASYDVLMFDICMPQLDGLEALKKIRKSLLLSSLHTLKKSIFGKQ